MGKDTALKAKKVASDKITNERHKSAARGTHGARSHEGDVELGGPLI